MSKEELLQQLHINDTTVDEINREIAKQRAREFQFPLEARSSIREFILQLEYWRRHKLNINAALKEFS